MCTDLQSDLVNSYAWYTAISFIEKCGTNSDYANKTEGNRNLKVVGNNSDEQCKICNMAENIENENLQQEGNQELSLPIELVLFFYLTNIII